MKIIHTSDLHLGSKISSRFPRELSDRLKGELRSSFMSLIDYAKREGVSLILLSGDVFDSDRPFKKDTDFFYRAVEANPEIDFIYLRGNHDVEGERRDIKNLLTFSEEWTCYSYGDLTVSGIEINNDNRDALYSTLSLDERKKNIVMLHGQTGSGRDSINLARLADKNIDYLALGHIHSHLEGRLDRRGAYAYSGCLFGRGFDECGEHGFIELTVGDKIESRFVKLGAVRIEELTLDVGGAETLYEIFSRADALSLSADKIYRIILTGEIDATIGSPKEELGAYFEGRCLYADVKDMTEKRIDYKAYENDLSLAGEFVRLVASMELTEEQRSVILHVGLRAIAGKEVEL